MRVLVVAAWPPWPLEDGARLVLHHQLTQLRARHEIIVVAVRRDPSGRDDDHEVGPLVEVVGPPPGLAAYTAARLRSAARLEPLTVGLLRAPVVVTRIQERARQHRPEVIHLFGWGTAALASDLPAIPTLHTALDAWSLGYRDVTRRFLRGLAELDNRWTIPRHERRHYPDVGPVVVVSGSDALALREVAPGADVRVVPNGIDVGPRPSPVSGGAAVGFTGNFRNTANVAAARHLVEAVVPRLRQMVPAVRVRIVGHRADRLGLEGSGVEIRSDVADMHAELAGLAVATAPMVGGTGLKNKILEALAAGVPVVATTRALGGIGAGDGILVADDVDSFARTVADLLADPDRRTRLGQAGRRRVAEHHSWEANARAVEDIWREVAASQVGER